VRTMALRVLREMVRCQPDQFHSYAELTTLKLLEAHKDPVKEVCMTYTTPPTLVLFLSKGLVHSFGDVDDVGDVVC